MLSRQVHVYIETAVSGANSVVAVGAAMGLSLAGANVCLRT